MKTHQNKIAVITGGNSGIGLALAKKMLSEGYKVIITSRNLPIDFSHEHLQVVSLEITDLSSIRLAVAEIKKMSNRVDLLINNAGVAPDISFNSPEYISFTETFDVNVKGLVFFAEEMLREFVNMEHVINISSAMELLEHAGSDAPAYRISKAALNMYTKTLSMRLKDSGTKVSAVHPGWVRTKLGGLSAPLTAEDSAEKIIQSLNKIGNTGMFFNVITDSSTLL